MSNIYDSLSPTGPLPVESAPPKSESSDNIYDQIPATPLAAKPQAEVRNLDPGSFAATHPNQPYGGIVSDRGFGASAMGNARASLAVDSPTQIKRYAAQFGLPESYFGVVNGDIVRWVPEHGVWAKVAPSVMDAPTVSEAIKRIPQSSATAAGPAIPMIAGAATGVFTGPTGASVPLVGALSAGADLARQALDKALAGEPTSEFGNYNYKHAIGEGVEQAAGQAVGLGLNKLATGNVLRVPYSERAVVTPAKQQAWKELDEEAQRRGFTGDSALTPGQVTKLPSLLTQERQMRRDPAVMDQLYARRDAQREVAAPQAFRDQLGKVSPTAGRENQIGGFREGADAVVEQALAEQKAIAKPAYEKAFKDKPSFYSDELDSLMQRPSMKEAYQQAQKAAAEAPDEPMLATIYRLPTGVKPGPYELHDLTFQKEIKPDWLSWQRMKQGLDDLIDSKAGKNELTGKLTPDGRRWNETKKSMMGILYKANPEWQEADLKFGNARDAVMGVLNGGVGIINDMDGPARQQIVNKMFSSDSLLPEEVTRARQLFVKAGAEDEWNGGLRGWMEGHLSRALKSGTDGEVANVPGKLYRDLWGEPDQRAVFEAALGDPRKADDMNKLMQVFRAAAKGLPEGSPTATDSVAKSNVTAGKVISEAFSGDTYLNFGRSVYNGIMALRDPAVKAKFANYLLSPEAKDDLAKLRLLSPQSQKAIALAGDILTNAGIDTALSASGVNQPPDIQGSAGPKPKPPAKNKSGVMRTLEGLGSPPPTPFARGGRVEASAINHSPSEAQKAAGNYAKDHVTIHGLNIAIENAKGSMRKGISKDGESWQVKMPAHYGYVKGTVGADKDHVDVYLGPHHKSKHVFVVDQKNAETGTFDEHKAFIGFATMPYCTKTYCSAFSDGKAHLRMGNVTKMTMDEFKSWLTKGDTTKPVSGK